jgi:hypothetical protein
MASIISGNINLSKIDKSKVYEGKKGKYYPVTVVINNEVGEYGDSGYIMTEQTKEQREAKEQKSYLGNVKVVWTDGENVSTTVRSEPQASMQMQQPMQTEEPDLPF